MHGIVHKTLKEYVEGIDAAEWDDVADRAGLDPKLYLPVSRYPDEEVDAVFAALAASTDENEAAHQTAFGRTLAPELLNTFKAHVRDDWGTQELLLALEVVYERVAAQDEESTLPDVATEADGGDIVVTYRSERELCAVAEGIVLGVAEKYDDEVTINERTCTKDGDDHCTLRVEFA
ncbi:Haem-NO-binding [Natronoarchaeum philippinense]|uniref:Haem-NO-binding n=1 Tax=Natronoarchaeum philippinense TaxID=558529 RepID=A0A285P2R0_NATPI|nr:heme NO-binding domain-containing protein [Natronoarchaeum philippinense]SNZ15728.1 Haem-NO-binding [Natronoarchaeum philippinense]